MMVLFIVAGGCLILSLIFYFIQEELQRPYLWKDTPAWKPHIIFLYAGLTFLCIWALVGCCKLGINIKQELGIC